MGFKSLLLVSLTVFLGFTEGRGAVKSDISTGDQWWMGGVKVEYDCSAKIDGNYPHPTKCSCYIACVNHVDAYEMQCGFNAQGQLLHYVATSGPSPQTSMCDVPEKADCENPVETCVEGECKQKGDCFSYQTCRDGHWTERICGKDLFWNPSTSGGPYGACDFWDNLSDEKKNEYLNNPSCIPECAWWQNPNEKCSGTYHYRAPYNGTNSLLHREETYACTPPLIWDPDTVTCDHASQVTGCN